MISKTSWFALHVEKDLVHPSDTAHWQEQSLKLTSVLPSGTPYEGCDEIIIRDQEIGSSAQSYTPGYPTAETLDESLAVVQLWPTTSMETSDSAISIYADGRLMTRPEKGRRDPQYLKPRTPRRLWCCNALGRRGYGIPMYGPCQTIPRQGMRELHGRRHRIEGGPSSY